MSVVMPDAGYQWIPLKPVEEMDPDLALMVTRWAGLEDGDPGFLRTFSYTPEILRRYISWSSPMWRKGAIQHRTKELCRIRIANSNGCRYCMTMRYTTGAKQGITPELEAGFEDFEAFEGFSDREKAALRYTDEVYSDDLTWDYDRIADDLYDRMRANFTEEELVELTLAICFAEEYGRLVSALGVPPAKDYAFAEAGDE
jgi:AhpD family alkylhydroperoxidase